MITNKIPTSVVVAGDRALQAGEDPEHGGQHPQREEEQRVAREDGQQGHRHRPCNQGLYCQGGLVVLS